jgi:hypothetical protein
MAEQFCLKGKRGTECSIAGEADSVFIERVI